MALQDNALTTVATVKNIMGITDDTQDDYIERQINVMSSKIEAYCNRKFNKQTFTDQLYKGYGTAELQLQNYPIRSITSIEENNAELDSSNYSVLGNTGINNAGCVIKLGGRWSRAGAVTDISQQIEYLEYNIKATYVSGYVLPKDDGNPDSRDLPYDLEEACIAMVKYALSTRYDIRDVKSEKTLEGSITYGNNKLNSYSGLLGSVESSLASGGYVRRSL